MQINWHYSWNVVEVVAFLLGWFVVLGFVIRQRQKQETKRPVWKIIVVTLVGLFSFSIKFPLLGEMVNVALLPLGCWIVYFFLRNRTWHDYRKIAWIGFSANYFFLILTLVSGLLYGFLYPGKDPSTYLANVEKAKLVAIHPSAREVSFDKVKFLDGLADIKATDMSNALDWYYEAKYEDGANYHHERFPYELLGAEARWGSGLHALVYIESDGKGLLLATNEYYYYYRSEKPILQLEVQE